MKTFREISQDIDEKKSTKITASGIVQMFKDNPVDWGDDMKDRAYVKKGNLVIIDSYLAGSEKAMEQLRVGWLPSVTFLNYFYDEYGVKVKIVDDFVEMTATGRHKKFSKNGIVGIVIKVG